jgi:cytochrome c oxidase subunit II
MTRLTGESMVARPSNRTLLRLIAALLVAIPLALTGCTLHDFPQTTFQPRSDFAGWVLSLNNQLILWVVIIFVLVQGLLIVAIVKFRARPDSPDPKPVHGNTALEIGWTIAPAIILAIVAVPTVLTIFKTQNLPPHSDFHVQAIGHQWWWEFEYPAEGFKTANEMHVPVGRTVVVDIASVDVIHSFWFPAMGGKRDAVPNHPNHMWFTPDSVGVYMGQCAEFCGMSHANMRMKLFVDTPEDYATWVAGQKLPPHDPGGAPSDSVTAVAASTAPTGSLAAQGKEIFSQNACIGCHTISGISEGIIGPNLNHFASRTSFAGAIFERNPDNLGKWLADAPSRKPGSLMMNLGLTPEQIQALVAYLQSLK